MRGFELELHSKTRCDSQSPELGIVTVSEVVALRMINSPTKIVATFLWLDRPSVRAMQRTSPLPSWSPGLFPCTIPLPPDAHIRVSGNCS